MGSNKPPQKRVGFHSPWVIETIIFFLVIWQESIRLELRTKHRELPIPEALQSFYYYNFGDFSNGFVNAFLIDGVTDLLLAGFGKLRAEQPKFQQLLTQRVRAAIATFLSIAIIVAFELRTSALTQADLADIPAGVAGALLYLGVRWGALVFRRSKLSQ